MVTGLSPFRSYQVAEEVEDRLLERRRLGHLRRARGDRCARGDRARWRASGTRRTSSAGGRWRQLDVPLVILIGGATGVGKSTIATQLAARLGIVRVVATDAIREVMRAMFSPS